VSEDHSSRSVSSQTLIGGAALVVSGVMAFGASNIASAAGYAGIGPNFLPWVVSVALAVCGLWLVYEAQRGGYRKLAEPSGAARGDWRAFAWVAAGLLLNASLLERIGFVLSCALCFTFAVRGFRSSEGKVQSGMTQTLKDAVLGMVIAAPVYWLFGKALKINLPGLTSSGWI
jgi:putative tricarboxylic transport membrane protein